MVVNLSAQPAQGRVPLDWTDLPGRSWHLTDLFAEGVFERDGDELASPGLFVALKALAVPPARPNLKDRIEARIGVSQVAFDSAQGPPTA